MQKYSKGHTNAMNILWVYELWLTSRTGRPTVIVCYFNFLHASYFMSTIVLYCWIIDGRWRRKGTI